ncbi:UbiX family flavin prenyltransferase [Anaerotardibacter muris]|uniref:UbiX family flavin prenyltransferase n=1 Tax=Anaerotardibacter muris TaxID=2941505 RepID=UPI002040970A|nr:UbiX family flavin prenyltransferase [Anaerotardibacter muris]
MKRIIVGISGASGSPLALRFLKALHQQEEVEVHLVVTSSALLTASYELADMNEAENPYLPYADHFHGLDSLDATISSGSFPIDAMVVIPCSMKTVAGIASGYTENLLLRAADVTIKEKRPLILVARESPLSPIHLKNLTYLSTLPTVSIVPPMLTYYSGQETIEDMEDHTIGKIFNLMGLEHTPYRRWNP